jgi:SAM-dependent methyltransferase
LHSSVLAFVKNEVLTRELAGRCVLEVGSSDVNGSARWFFTGPYVGVDWQQGSGVDMVMSAHELGFPTGSFEVVVCTEMLEHDTKPWVSMREMIRVLEPFGVLLLSARGFDSHGCFHYHNPPDNYRYSAAAIKALLEDAGFLIEGVWRDPHAPGYFAVGVKP